MQKTITYNIQYIYLSKIALLLTKTAEPEPNTQFTLAGAL